MSDFVRTHWRWLALAGALFVVALILFRWIAPAPPSSIRIAGGAPGGAYALAVEGYAERLSGVIGVEIAPSPGSRASLDMLREGEVDAAIIQAGVAREDDLAGKLSLGALFYEPVWLFYWRQAEVSVLTDLRGKSVVLGAQGSGTQALARMLLSLNGVDGTNADLQEMGAAEAQALLERGEIDAMFVVAGERSSRVREMIANPDIEVLSFERATAYARRLPYLDEVVLPEGGFDLQANLPERPIRLIAPAAQLVVREDLHPAVQSLLVETIGLQHGGGDLFSAPHTFPNPVLVDLPLSPEADRYYKNGPSFLRRYFSYAWANFIERTWVFFLPLIPLGIALADVAPPVWRWRIRRRIYSWYGDLKELENQGRLCTSETCRREVVRRIRALQLEAATIKAPQSYHDELYSLREHIDLVEKIVLKLGEQAGDETAETEQT